MILLSTQLASNLAAISIMGTSAVVFFGGLLWIRYGWRPENEPQKQRNQ